MPQTENGYLKIANEIIEALAKIRISGEEMQCLWVIFRKTYGWNKKEDWISLDQFQEATGIKKPNVIRALSKLLIKNMIIKKDNGKGVSYCFQKHYIGWKPLSKKITVIKKDNIPLSKKIPTKDTITKNIVTKGKTNAPLYEDYRPSDKMKEWCKKHEIDRSTFDNYVESCLDWFRSEGKKKLDWEATIKGWIRRDREKKGIWK